ncbi:MAG: TIGR03619 family F420-dependent LLM class oxidoreductase [Chloroflexi bacterium]|nr:TIGR03619 family F420-dependent LLM class oxidoreductase [Chloroflexota bacterium]
MIQRNATLMGMSRPRVSVFLSHLEGLSGPNQSDLLEIAQAVDRAGVDQLVLSEHVALAAEITGHPGQGSGTFPFPPDHEYPEPLISLAAIAGVTTNVRLGTYVLIAPLRPAVLLAKMAATLDVLSHGRLDLAVGTGWHEPEFTAMGIPMERRGHRVEMIVRACQALWGEAPASFHSDVVSFDSLHCSPRPVQRGGVPIWFGGSANELVANRVAELGRGWSPMGGGALDEIRRGVELIRHACEGQERDFAEIDIRSSLPAKRDDQGRPSIERTLAAIPDYVAAGVTTVQLPALPTFVRRVEDAEPFLRGVMRAVQELSS